MCQCKIFVYLSNSAETPGGNLLSVKLNGVLREAEPLLDDRGQFTDPKQKNIKLRF